MVVEKRTGDGPMSPAGPCSASGTCPRWPRRSRATFSTRSSPGSWGAVRKLPCPFQRAALLMARWSGARRGEIRRLELGCLDSYPDGTPEESSRQDLPGEGRDPRAAGVVCGSVESPNPAFGFRQVGAGGLLIGPVPEFANSINHALTPIWQEGDISWALSPSFRVSPMSSRSVQPAGLPKKDLTLICYFCCAASILLFACNTGSLIPNSFSAFSPSIFRLAVSLRNGKSYIALGVSKSWCG